MTRNHVQNLWDFFVISILFFMLDDLQNSSNLIHQSKVSIINSKYVYL